MARIWFMSALSMLLMSSALASPESTWKTIGGSFMGYYESGLPKPVVIYVLNQKEGLVGVVETGGSYAQEQIARVKQAVLSKAYLGSSKGNAKLGDAGKRLEVYLNDQGYSLSDLADTGASDVVLLISWNTGNLDCDWLQAATEEYRSVVLRGFQQQDNHDKGYAFIELKLDTRQVEVSCPKQPTDAPM